MLFDNCVHAAHLQASVFLCTNERRGERRGTKENGKKSRSNEIEKEKEIDR